MKRKLLLLTTCVMVASLTVAQERMKEVSGNEAINHNKQAVKADKNAVMKQDQAKEEATMNKSNGLYEATDEAKAKWIKENPQAYRDQVIKNDTPRNPNLIAPGHKVNAFVPKDRPVYVDSGNPEQDKQNYLNAKNKWLKKNDPEAYQRIKKNSAAK
ncbi:MAG: hypothetical protein HON99_04895 [Crocinitomicaceae bacterium]|jgi:hypothetical protein|nr:hypothetical protein [Crocinitomicaceae bacterium]